MTIQIKELETENEIDTLLTLLSYENEIKQRIKQDFNRCYFRSLCATQNDEWLGFLVFCDSYSTWQHRIFFCSDVFLRPSLNKEEKFKVLKCLFDQLFQLVRNDHANRINLNINSELDKEIIDMICQLGAVNLTENEQWLIFEMGFNEMKNFIQHKPTELKSEYKLIPIDSNNFHLYIDQVINLIREIAIFEKMLDQFATSKDNLLRDYQYTERENRLIKNDINKSRYYELIVLVKGEEVVGYSFYHLKYELKKGLGFYLEEIFMKDTYRGQGLGTILWQRVVDDILTNFKEAAYLHWTVLEWNKNAIDFYYKFKSTNLNEIEKLNHIRFCTPVIYSQK